MNEKVSSFYNASANVEAIDSSLRQYIKNVFMHMACGLAVTALIAYFVANSEALLSMMFSARFAILGLCLVELFLVGYLSIRITKMSSQQAKSLFYLYSMLNGLTIAPLCLVYTGISIATTFFVASSMFLSMSIYGYVTDKDLTSFGGFLIMGLFGMIIASIVNLFVHSSGMSFVISAIGVLLFTGLTAYDTQAIKSLYFEADSTEVSEKKAILGALTLYLDFINLFLHLLRFLGDRRD